MEMRACGKVRKGSPRSRKKDMAVNTALALRLRPNKTDMPNTRAAITVSMEERVVMLVESM